jgi:hypothetical protein
MPVEFMALSAIAQVYEEQSRGKLHKWIHCRPSANGRILHPNIGDSTAKRSTSCFANRVDSYSSYIIDLINIVLLPMQRGVGLDDDGFARRVFQIFDQGGLARFQGFGDFGIDAQG